jgi:hypothetical protein
MLTLPPAHTLGAALSQATAGALGSLLTIGMICAPLLLMWWGCRWLERHLPDLPVDAASAPDGTTADGDSDGDDAQVAVTTTSTAPTLRALRSLGRQTLMHPQTLSDVELAEVETAPALWAIPSPPLSTPPSPPPSAAPSATHLSAFPLYEPPAAAAPSAPSSQPSQPWEAWDNWPPRGKPGQYPYRYIFVGSVLVRVASLYPYIAFDSQPQVWN